MKKRLQGKFQLLFRKQKKRRISETLIFINPNSAYFKKVDDQIAQLRDLGIEADIILFHPYDKWGFSTMEKACNEQYLQYMVARYSAYHNVWWIYGK